MVLPVTSYGLALKIPDSPQPAKNRQKDKDTHWTKKHGKSHYGYKTTSMLIAASGVWADSAYRSAEIEAVLAARGLTSHIHRRGTRNKPLTKRQEAANKVRSKVRARAEHVFGNQHGSIGGKFLRTIGILRASMKFGMQNLAYNMRRLVVLERSAMATAKRPASAIRRGQIGRISRKMAPNRVPKDRRDPKLTAPAGRHPVGRPTSGRNRHCSRCPQIWLRFVQEFLRRTTSASPDHRIR